MTNYPMYSSTFTYDGLTMPVIHYCYPENLKERLKQRLLKHVNETGDDFTEILDELIQHESIDDELAYRKLDKAAKDFMLKLKYPEPETVMIGLKLVEG